MCPMVPVIIIPVKLKKGIKIFNSLKIVERMIGVIPSIPSIGQQECAHFYLAYCLHNYTVTSGLERRENL